MFFAALEQAVAQISGGKGRVLAQVPLSRLIEAKAGDAREKQRWHNKIDRKSVDFVVVDSAFKVKAAIELDDLSHGRTSRKERDAFVERACADAGVALVRFAARAQYDVGVIAHELEKAMGSGSAAVEVR